MSATLAAITVAATTLGLALSASQWGEHHLALIGDVRVRVVVAAGALLFGAGR